MKIKFARIDDRLIHGQVATVWSKYAGADRIIVVSDEVSSDPIRSVLVKQAAPPGIKANVVSIAKAARVYKNPKYINESVFFLFTKPEEVVDLIKNGVPIKSINIGGMHYKEGKKQITKAISVDENDTMAFKKLNEMGVELDLRVVPTDSKGNLMKILKESNL